MDNFMYKEDQLIFLSKVTGICKTTLNKKFSKKQITKLIAHLTMYGYCTIGRTTYYLTDDDTVKYKR